MDMIKKASVLANDIMDSVHWLVDRMHSPGRDFDRAQLIGVTAEVTIPIRRGQVGEVMVPLGRTLQNYSARSIRPDLDFSKGSRVKIAEVGTSMVFVDSCESPEEKAAGPFTVIGEVEDYCE